MRRKKATIIDVAKEADVSIASVSRFLHNPYSVKQKNRDRIARAIRLLNYTPVAYAQRLAGGKLRTIGLVIPGYEGIFHSYFALEVIKNVGAAIEHINHDLYINIYWSRDTLRESLVDGVIFVDIAHNQKQLERLMQQSLPVVVINNTMQNVTVSSVSIDNFKGAYQAVEFLIKQGHIHIAHLAGDLNIECARQRVEGYEQALKNYNLPVKEEYIKKTHFSRIEARSAFKELLESDPRPTAIFAASDEVAHEVLLSAQDKGYNVPHDFSIIGFDDNPQFQYNNFSLTTVRQPLDKMAQRAVDLLREMIESDRVFTKKIILDTELVLRDSVSSR